MSRIKGIETEYTREARAHAEAVRRYIKRTQTSAEAVSRAIGLSRGTASGWVRFAKTDGAKGSLPLSRHFDTIEALVGKRSVCAARTRIARNEERGTVLEEDATPNSVWGETVEAHTRQPAPERQTTFGFRSKAPKDAPRGYEWQVRWVLVGPDGSVALTVEE